MKKLILIGTAMLAFAVAGSAATVSRLPACQSAGQALSTIGAGCYATDKEFTNFTTWGNYTAIPGDWRLSIEVLGVEHIVDLARAGGTAIGPGNYGIQYDVKVLPGFGMLIGKAAINVNTSTSTATLTKWVYDLTPGLNHGNLLGMGSTTAGAVSFPLVPASTWIQVQEKLTVSTGSTFSSFTDAYTQVTPEPGTYAMMGLGLAALGLISRRKKA